MAGSQTGASRVAATIIVGLEALGLAGLAVWQLVSLIADGAASLATGIALLVLTLIGAAAVASFSVAILRGASWGRSGGIVTQLLILAVALGAATGAYAHPLAALGLAAPAIVAFVLLIILTRSAAPRRDAEADGDGGEDPA